jgi:L-lactate dehydrogenase
MAKNGTKISIIGAGNVGATVAYTLTISGMASEIVLIDVSFEKAVGEAMDIIQGTAFCPPTDIYAGHYENAADSDIVIITAGVGRKPGQTRIDLAQTNINILKEIMPEITRYAPDAVYIVVSNPVDVLTYWAVKYSTIPENRIIGSGTMLDSTRLRTALSAHVGVNAHDMQAYVLGEHGDSAMIPWSLTSIAGMKMDTYCEIVCDQHNQCGKVDLQNIAKDVMTAGAKVIERKGATFYAVSLSVRHLCEAILRDSDSIMTVSSMMHGQYGIDDVCLSLPFIIGASGIKKGIPIELTQDELEKLQNSAKVLKNVIASLEF